eukprot:CAMPEP_0178387294 /NCGR_PEP_ID=MMETSP0689_2-20121128/9000_1 /TAXON_ID=160604 /ORGANISM="Amphidinium massartii, Strain CS-259" /LENGTH=434 /DNA_ID=CAMNT_0020007655 /DNA_START=152 /DNA_END=1452 /DNA_ORIENTATION=+
MPMTLSVRSSACLRLHLTPGSRPCASLSRGRPRSHEAAAHFQQHVCQGHRRHVAGVRRLMSDFIKQVHPDLTPQFPETARQVNQSSLGELNALIDKLEASRDLSLEDGPEAGREIPFFRSYVTRAGRELPGRVLQLRLPLPALQVGASEDDREFAAVRLIRDAELVIERTAGGFSDQPQVPPLFTQPGAGRCAFDKLWWQQTREEMLRLSMEGPSEEELRRQALVKVFAEKYEYRLLRRYTRIKNTRRRRLKLAKVESKVESLLEQRFGSEALKPIPEEESEEEVLAEASKAAARLARMGFHPDLVFLVQGLDETKRREAVRRVCGMNLEKESDVWLLENLWKAMRESPPAVPLVVAHADYRAHVDKGFVQVPYDFTVAGLCDLLEEWLDDVRDGLARRRSGYRMMALPKGLDDDEQLSLTDGTQAEEEDEGDP